MMIYVAVSDSDACVLMDATNAVGSVAMIGYGVSTADEIGCCCCC
jgi:hypothetical protein